MSNQGKVGIVVILGILVLGMIVTWKSAFISGLSGYEMIGSFNSIEGLTIGSEIRYRGFKVGKVVKIDPTPEDIRIYCNIDKSIRFPADSLLRVAFDGLVGLKYLEIKPGKSTDLYKAGDVLAGQKTAGIVDFVDSGTQAVVEMKQILTSIKNIVERPDIQMAFINAVKNVEKVSYEIDQLTRQLQMAVAAINNVVADKEFQQNFKGIAASTNKTLSSANDFFDSFSNLKVRASGDILLGGLQNQVKGNIDIIPNSSNMIKMSMGEGPTRNLALLDLQLQNMVTDKLGLRLGMINTHLGGGIDYIMDRNFTVSGDLYDVNNPKPNNPKVRVTGDYRITDFVKFLLQADDFLNGNTANYSFGVRVTGR